MQNVNYNQGKAISPLDGRYLSKVNDLEEYCSEYALMKYRTQVEIEYFIYFCERVLDYNEKSDDIRTISDNFGIEDYQTIKKFEEKTNHDVKAVEYFIRDRLEQLHVPVFYRNHVHFGLTSHDTNSPAMILNA